MPRRTSLLFTLLTGCGMGGMGQATLTEPTVGGARPVPVQPLAVGAHFRPHVTIEIPGATTPNLTIRSSRPDVIAVDQGELVAQAPGMAAILITDDRGTVIDFLHLWADAATDLVLERLPDREAIHGAIDLVPGDDVALDLRAYAGAQALSGELDATWSVEDCSGACPVSILRSGGGERRLRARAPGKATVRIAAASRDLALAVEVQP